MRPVTPIERWQKVWAVLLPHIPVPSDAEAAVWQKFPQVEVDRAINRCRLRYALSMIHDGFKPSDAYNWVTFVANEAAKTERKRVLKKLQFGVTATDPVTSSEPDDNIGNRA
jgi:hypothetical protein